MLYLLYIVTYSEDAKMLAVRLPKDLEDRLTRLAKQTGRTKAFYARKAIEDTLEDMEDIFIAIHRLENPPERYLTTEELKKELGLLENEEAPAPIKRKSKG